MAAVVVLLLALAGSAGALFIASTTALTAATVGGMVAGVVIAALMFAEIVVLRRVAARDRAVLADSYRHEAKARGMEQVAFVRRVNDQIQVRDTEIDRQRAQIEQLRAEAVDAEIELAHAKERVAAERGRVDELIADARTTADELETARADLLKAQDALAASEAAGVQAQAQIEAWEQATGVDSPDALTQHRRTA